MAPKRTATGLVRPGEQKNQSNILTGTKTFTGSTIIDLQRTLFKRRKVVDSFVAYEVIGLTFEDAGGATAELAQRLSSLKNADGTFTITAEKARVVDTPPAVLDWTVAVSPVTVRWTVLVTA